MARAEHLVSCLLLLLPTVLAQLDLPPLYDSRVRGGYNEPPRPVSEPRKPDEALSNRDLAAGAVNNVDIPALLQEIDDLGTQQCTSNVLAQWNYETDVNEVTQLAAYSRFQHAVWDVLNKIPGDQVKDHKMRRELKFLAAVGPSALPPELLDRYVWYEWRRRTGQKIRDLFEQMAHVSNQAAKLNNFTDTGDYWMFPYESPTFRFDVEDAWEQVKPLYVQLHTDHYGPEKIHRRAPIAAHILGNMWGQSWGNILDITIPYPGKHFIDVTPEMQAQGYVPATLFKLAEQFFIGLNMTPMPPEFWAKSVFQELPDRHVICQPSAWDFCNGKDYRIKMCAQVTMKDLITAHHEMAHVQYFMHYKHLPKVFRDGANPDHFAVGDAIALSVSTPEHLQSLGLLQRSVDHHAHETNFLFSQALDKLPFMAFALAVDRWRWDVFGAGAIGKERYNCHWWSLRYFVGSVLQYQLHRALCIKAGQYDPHDAQSKPLYKCDISRSVAAGELLKRMMSLGASRPWQEALKEVTGESKLDASALREYFHHLEDWLHRENQRTQEFIGWIYDGDYCKHSIETAGLQVYGGFYNLSPRLVAPTAALLVATLLTLLLS
ncbi:hypothetical protein B566_EDAN005583 [Ephemera danica]|nr:hypothetical protein B566_EDAN005583 [Ephemera danica]